MAAKRPIDQSTPKVKIPTSFTLPGGYRVRVKFVTFDEMQKLAHEGAADCAPEEKAYAFYWDKGGHGIMYLVRGRHPLLVAMDFAHEIKHAWPEWEDWWLARFGVDAVVEAAADGRAVLGGDE